MKAIVREVYGPPDVLGLKDVEAPTPREHEVLTSVCSASANATDPHEMRGQLSAYRRTLGPKGTYVMVGGNTTQFWQTRFIERQYSLSKVPAAVRYLKEVHARGKAVIAVRMDKSSH